MSRAMKGVSVAEVAAQAPNATSTEVQVFVPYRAGLPPLRQYFRAVWARRELLQELTRSDIRAENMDTLFGRVWNVLNPLLLGIVYWVLVLILVRGGTTQYYLAYLLSGLFMFDVLAKAATPGVRSMTSNSALVTKTAMPRVILPISNVWIAVSRYWPTLAVLVIIALGVGVRPHWAWIVCIPFFALFVVFILGFVLLMATLQVYFRDTRNFLAYVLRIWMFLSPVLWTVGHTPAIVQKIALLNPLYSYIGGFSEAFVYGNWPPLAYWIAAVGWAVTSILVGGYFFLSREREFAIRI